MTSTVEEPLSANQRRNARKKRAKQTLPSLTSCGKFGYKYNHPVRRKFFLYRNETFERWPKNHGFFHFSSSQLKLKILNQNVGVTFDDVDFSVLPLPLFDNLLEDFLQHFKTTRFKQMLDHFCPTKGATKCPADIAQVVAFVRSVLFQCRVLRLFGPEGNVRRVEKAVESYVSSGRGTAILLGTAMLGMEGVIWLDKVNPPGLRQNMLAKTVAWLLSDLVNPLLCSMFHVTDSTHSRHQLFYYRKSTWQSLTTSVLQSLLNQGRLRSLKPEQVSKLLKCPHAAPTSSLRFVPKRNLSSVRPIARYKKNVEDVSSLLALIRQFSSKVPARADLGGRCLHLAWQKLAASVPPKAKLYWAITDITDAYGSVKLRKLISILTNLSKSSTLPDSKSLLERIKRRLALHTVEYLDGGKRRKYLVVHGLLQGDPLSSDLSDIYFGDLTQTHLGDFLVPPPQHSEIFLRGMDDFLFISTSKDRVSQFLSRVQAGFPSHSCTTRKDKTKTNLLTECQTTPIEYCGSLLHLQSRETSPDMSFYSTANLAVVQAWPKPGQRPMSFISNRMSFFSRQRLVPLYMDQYNSAERRLSTIAQVTNLAGRRLSVMLDTLVWKKRRPLRQEWAWRLVMGAGRKVTRIGRRVGLEEKDVKWVAMTCLLREVEREVRYPKEFREKLAKLRVGVKRQREKVLINLVKSA